MAVMMQVLIIPLVLSHLIAMGKGFERDTPSLLSPEYGNKRTASRNLDRAVDLIKKVRYNYPTSATRPSDCEDVLRGGQKKSAVYKIWPMNRVVSGPVEVYCDMRTDGGGWTVIQRRGDFNHPNDYFFQNWKSYKKGFGNVAQDFWLGNDNIFALTNQKQYSARFDLKDVEGSRRFALYDTFWIEAEEHKYMLHIGGYSGDAGDSMMYHNGHNFTTEDQDNDIEPGGNCAESFRGGWWYVKCHVSNLNGLYHKGKHKSYADGVIWHAWKGHYESMESTEIKIRSKQFRKPQYTEKQVQFK